MSEALDHPKPAQQTDGDASNPGPGKFRSRRRGPRSEQSIARRLLRHKPEEEPCTDDVLSQYLTFLHLNIQGWTSHNVQLAARIRLMPQKPALIFLNETFLGKKVEKIKLEGYTEVHRLDRRDGRAGGGVLLLVACELEHSVTFLEEGGEEDERIWALVHTNHGPYLACCWYRPPGETECESITRFSSELNRLYGHPGHHGARGYERAQQRMVEALH